MAVGKVEDGGVLVAGECGVEERGLRIDAREVEPSALVGQELLAPPDGMEFAWAVEDDQNQRHVALRRRSGRGIEQAAGDALGGCGMHADVEPGAAGEKEAGTLEQKAEGVADDLRRGVPVPRGRPSPPPLAPAGARP